MEYLTKQDYISIVSGFNAQSKGHWSTITNERWDYYGRAIGLIKELGLRDPSKIIEMGTMGISCVKGIDTIDYAEQWDFPGKQPTYLHDARQLPWPITDKSYELFIALRVYQHLAPMQKECTIEAMRIAKKVIIVVPPTYNLAEMFPESKGIHYNDFVAFLEGIHPNIYTPTLAGGLYYWDTEAPSTLNLLGVMEPHIIPNQVPHLPSANKRIPSAPFQKAKRMVKKILGQ